MVYDTQITSILVPVTWPKNPTDLASAISMLLFKLQHQNAQAAQHSFCQIGGMSRLRWSASRYWSVQCLPSCRSSPSDWIEWWSMELVGSVSNLPPPVGEGGREEKSSNWRWLKVELTFWWPCSRQSVVHLFEQLWTWIETWEAPLPCLPSLMKDFKPNITSFIKSLQFHMFDARRFFSYDLTAFTYRSMFLRHG